MQVHQRIQIYIRFAHHLSIAVAAQETVAGNPYSAFAVRRKRNHAVVAPKADRGEVENFSVLPAPHLSDLSIIHAKPHSAAPIHEQSLKLLPNQTIANRMRTELP